MTIRIYKYSKPPRNPSLRPNIFQEKYHVRDYERDLPGNLRDGIIKFTMNMNLAFGCPMDYDWDRPECHDMRNRDNELIEDMLIDGVMLDLRGYLHGIGEELWKDEFSQNNERFYYKTYFAETEMEYEQTEIVSRNQISISSDGAVFVSFLSHRFIIG